MLGLIYRGQYKNSEMVELELEHIAAHVATGPRKVTTTERDALQSVVAGTIVFNSTTSKLNFWTGSAWEVITSS